MSETDERPRILVAGDGAVPTGFARVMEGIFTPLAERYEIHQLATNYRGPGIRRPRPAPVKIAVTTRSQKAGQ